MHNVIFILLNLINKNKGIKKKEIRGGNKPEVYYDYFFTALFLMYQENSLRN